ncbi:MAG: hypothetical protein ACE366_13090 [Bradymonadia bacterium]
MTFGEQFKALGRALAAPRRAGPRTLAWLGTYALALGVIFGGFAWVLVAYQGDLGRGVLQFFLPDDWLFAGEFLVERFWASQARSVLVSLTLGGALMLSSVLLFPIKEKLGATFEDEATLTGKPIHEFPLWYQAWEEIKLFLLYTALAFVVLRLGHTPDPTRRQWAKVLSYAVLCLTFSIDFLAPLLQRHRHRYSQIVKVMLRRPLLVLGFGCLFALPPALVGSWLAKSSTWPIAEVLALGLMLNLVSLLGAVLVGNALGAALLADTERTPVSSLPVRGLTWLVVMGVLSVNLYVFGQIGRAAWGITPVLKCEYSLDPTTLDIDVSGLLSPTLTVSGRVEIHNPTDRDVELADHRIELRHRGDLLTQSKLPRMSVPAGGREQADLSFELSMGGGVLGKGMALAKEVTSGGVGDALGALADAGSAAIDKDFYAITLIIPTDLEEFPIYLYAGEKSASGD